jgi:3-deoxy-manno-octulosonate cytidylyltransferase (CMP-KDO synthetase)
MATPKVAAVLPSRYASSRFPGKPLALIAGKPLIQHVWERCSRARHLETVLVATDDDRIEQACRDFGAQVVMTSSAHASGTDRVGEVAAQHPEFTHFINVQGDEPLISPALIEQLAATLLLGRVRMVTAANPLTDPQHFTNPNVVKVVLDRESDALYFSRAPIPFHRDGDRDPGSDPGYQLPPHVFRHHGIYGYEAAFLREFIKWPQSDLEQIEQLEQLRALERGIKIHVIQTTDRGIGVDTPQDVTTVEEILAKGGINPNGARSRA